LKIGETERMIILENPVGTITKRFRKFLDFCFLGSHILKIREIERMIILENP